MNKGLGVLLGVLAVILLIAVSLGSSYNNMVRLSENVDSKYSDISVQLKRRADLIPNLIEVVKGYSKYERDTFEEVVKLRNGDYDDLSNDEKINTNEKLSKGIRNIMALAEDYPELKANESFLQLNSDLASLEDEIAQSRKYYNAVVRDYNNKVEMLPSNLVAKILGYKSKLMFTVNDEERQSIKVKL